MINFTSQNENMKKRTTFAITFALLATITFTSCGSSETKVETSAETTETTEEETSEAMPGEELYAKSGCVACHQVDAKVVGPSIKTIAAAYKGNEEGLINFLKGEGEAIVDPEQAAVMQPQIEVTKVMSDEDRNAITDYIMNI